MASQELLYLTELLGLRVHDLRRRRIGVVKDAALVPVVDPRRVDRFLVAAGGAWLTVRFDQVRSISLDGIYLKDEQLTPYHSDEYMLRMVRDLLDQQIIDAQGRKVVRVNDVTFELRRNGHAELWVLEVDIGIRSVFRRLAQGVLPRRLIRRLQAPVAPHSIRWEYCNILEPDPQRRLRLNISNKLLEQMHPADLADIVEELGPEDREAIFETIDSEVAAETLSEVDPEMQASILESLEKEKAAEIIEEMSPHDAAAVLGEMEEETSKEILEELDVEPKAEVAELMEFDPDTAGGMMDTSYIALPENATAGDAVRALQGNPDLLENLNTLFLVDAEERLTGSVPTARLFLAAPAAPLRELKQELVVSIKTGDGERHAIELFDKYNLLSLPVVDDEGKLVGVIAADEVIARLRQK
jgi:CBS domain-containing protein